MNRLHYIGTDWRTMRDNFTVDQLVNLNLRVTKDIKVYSIPSGGVVWEGWTIYAHTNAGVCDTWIDGKEFAQYGYVDKNVDGIYLGMKGTAATQNKTYYIKLEKNLIDWNYIKSQIDDNQRSTMNSFEQFVESLDTQLNATKDAVTDTVTTAVYWTIGLVGTYLLYTEVLKPYIFYKTARSTASDLIKELKTK